MAWTTGYAGRAPVRESSAHGGGAVEMRGRGRVDTSGIVDIIVYMEIIR
jgi:hypothetical protein